MLQTIHYSESTTIDSIAEILNLDGVVRIPNFLTKDILESLHTEYQQLLKSANHPGIIPLDYSTGEGVHVKTQQFDKAAYPTTWSVFQQDLMRQLTDEYLGTPNQFNTSIYVVRDVPGIQHHAQDLHYDMHPALKFFIYLNDVTATNGAFYCVPKSHKHTRTVEAENRNRLLLPKRSTTRELPQELVDQQVPVEGPAGTMIIFHTDVFHRAGNVSSGERLVMRGHSMSMDKFKHHPIQKAANLVRALSNPMASVQSILNRN